MTIQPDLDYINRKKTQRRATVLAQPHSREVWFRQGLDSLSVRDGALVRKAVSVVAGSHGDL